MTRTQRWAVVLSNLLVGGTGLAYGWTCYFAESDDPFSIVNHPWQPHLQHWHILTAPTVVFVVGVLWQGHIAPMLRATQAAQRRSGLVLILMFFPMVLSGYALQVSMDEGWQRAWRWIHGSTSVAWLLFAVAHARRLGRRTRS